MCFQGARSRFNALKSDPSVRHPAAIRPLRARTFRTSGSVENLNLYNAPLNRSNKIKSYWKSKSQKCQNDTCVIWKGLSSCGSTKQIHPSETFGWKHLFFGVIILGFSYWLLESIHTACFIQLSQIDEAIKNLNPTQPIIHAHPPSGWYLLNIRFFQKRTPHRVCCRFAHCGEASVFTTPEIMRGDA